MDSATIAGRGVGPEVRSSLLPRARRHAIALVLALGLALLVSMLPAAAMPAPTSGSDRIAALQRDIRRAQAQLEATAARVATLTARRDTLTADLGTAKERAARAKADLAAARKETRAAAAALASTRPEHAAARAGQKSTRAHFEAAQDVMTRTQARLDEVSAAADKAAAEVERTAAAAKRSGADSGAGTKGFTTWQMAAVADRAAHARMVLVEDRAADAFVDLQEAEAALTKADFSEAEAAKALAEAEAAAGAASARVAALTAERATADAAVSSRTKDLATVSAALARASALSDKLTTRLAGLRRKVADLEGSLATATSGPRTSLSVSRSLPGSSVASAATSRKGKEAWRESGEVVRVLDGDTFDMTSKGTTIRVRITGIQAPESKWCGGKEARKALQAVLPKGTEVRLSSIKAKSGNAPTGVWRVKRTVHVKVGQEWVNLAPPLLAKGLVFPFPFIGEDAHNDEYLALSWRASEAGLGLYDASACGASTTAGERLRLEVVADGPGPASADAEFVMVFNGSKRDIELSRWMVQDTSPLNAFFFPKGARVRADDYVVVFSGKGTRGVAPDGSRDERFFYAGTGMRWNNDTADIAFLFDDAGKDRTGNLRSWLIVPPGA
jgi:endonuclease YncB( thermonuclease family)/predicted  nucleic acid-binding Zn-ribbon protein